MLATHPDNSPITLTTTPNIHPYNPDNSLYHHPHNSPYPSHSWVLLKNVHLAPQWLVQLEKKLHSITTLSNFRLFLTMEVNPKVRRLGHYRAVDGGTLAGCLPSCCSRSAKSLCSSSLPLLLFTLSHSLSNLTTPPPPPLSGTSEPAENLSGVHV